MYPQIKKYNICGERERERELADMQNARNKNKIIKMKMIMLSILSKMIIPAYKVTPLRSNI